MLVCSVFNFMRYTNMGLNDREYRQKDSWKNIKFNESKGEMEFEIQKPFKSSETSQATNRSKLSAMQKKNKEYLSTLNSKKKPFSFSFIPWIIALIIILAISKAIHKNSNNEQFTKLSPPVEQSSNILEPIIKSETLPIPPTSVLSTTYEMQLATCPFTIIADKKSNYYLKLCDVMRGDKTVAKFFIRAGEELTTKVPAGNYKIKFGSGDHWYGEENLFGQFSRYGESGAMDFEDNGYSANGHTLSFYNTVSGNFHTNDIGRDAVAQD